MVFVDVKKNSPHTLVLEDKDTSGNVRRAEQICVVIEIMIF